MFRTLLSILALLTLAIQIQAQTEKKPSFFIYDASKGVMKTATKSINPLAGDPDGGNGNDGPPFISPKNALVKFQRQVTLQLFPAGFFPDAEPEKDSSRRSFIRYGIAYYRDNEIPNISGFFDVIVGFRLDSSNGFLDIKYYRDMVAVPFTFDFPEDRSALALLPSNQGTALFLFLQGTSNKFLFSLDNLFNNPAPEKATFLALDEVESIQSDSEFQKFIIFTRGGANRSSLFASTTDPSLAQISQGTELIKDLPINNEIYVFKVSPNSELKLRATPVPPK